MPTYRPYYIFDVYVHTDPNNGWFDYKVLPEFPHISKKNVLHRTNRLQNRVYFELSKGKIVIANNENMTGAMNLKLLAKCENSFYIFKGDIPQPSRVKSSSNDVYAAAEHFVPAVGLEEVVNTGNLKASAKKIAKYMSADMLHSAMSFMSAEDLFAIPNGDYAYNEKDISGMSDALLTEYVPKFSKFDKNKAMQCVINNYKLAAKSINNAFDGTHNFVTGTSKIYSNYPFSMFKTDVATGILGSNKINNESVQYAFDVMDAMDDNYGKSSNYNRIGLSTIFYCINKLMLYMDIHLH